MGIQDTRQSDARGSLQQFFTLVESPRFFHETRCSCASARDNKQHHLPVVACGGRKLKVSCRARLWWPFVSAQCSFLRVLPYIRVSQDSLRGLRNHACQKTKRHIKHDPNVPPSPHPEKLLLDHSNSVLSAEDVGEEQ